MPTSGQRGHAAFNLGLSLPTGSITEPADAQPDAPMRLAYSMQLGSGTCDLHPSLT
ncbi:hypothetical protein [Roseovarius sp. A-2]|uniref:hypothetical protein n=1 Tax=Roseovarius sp. A-2 TaxID=1570360 RepID=UPI0015946132|nr:hypothetical protein [Roseovarius sp. A-2]